MQCEKSDGQKEGPAGNSNNLRKLAFYLVLALLSHQCRPRFQHRRSKIWNRKILASPNHYLWDRDIFRWSARWEKVEENIINEPGFLTSVVDSHAFLQTWSEHDWEINWKYILALSRVAVFAARSDVAGSSLASPCTTKINNMFSLAGVLKWDGIYESVDGGGHGFT